MRDRLTNKSQWLPHIKISAESRLRRLHESGPGILQGALAAALAWAVATHVLGHAHPFFAPLAALVATGLSHSQRTSRIAELILGVAVGILVADLAISVIGV